MPSERSATRPFRLIPCSLVPALAAALLLGACATAGAATVNLGNVMPLGDSITDGVGSSGGGYRDPLYTDLISAGFSFTYVGSATDNSTTTLTNAGQQHHEGHSGYVIQSKDPTDTGSGSGRGGILDNLNTWIGPGGANPQYVLLMIGTNDVDINYFPQNWTSRLSSLVSAISNKSTGLRPNAKLILAQITPTGSSTENLRVQTYNAGVATVVAQHQALGENVTMVDMYDALNPATDLSDTLHPNNAGYAKMANVWLQGIQFASVPEPGSAGLFGAVAVAALFRRRRPGRVTG